MSDLRLNHELTETQIIILEALKNGNTRKAAAEYAGIGRTTFYEWMEKNPTFADAVTQAEATAEVGFTTVLSQAALAGDWRASLEWLRRRRPEDWGDNIRHDLDAEIERLMEELAGGREKAAVSDASAGEVPPGE